MPKAKAKSTTTAGGNASASGSGASTRSGASRKRDHDDEDEDEQPKSKRKALAHDEAAATFVEPPEKIKLDRLTSNVSSSPDPIIPDVVHEPPLESTQLCGFCPRWITLVDKTAGKNINLAVFELLIRHVKNTHEADAALLLLSRYCFLCQIWCDSPAALIAHFKLHPHPFNCLTCGFKSSEHDQCARHYNMLHDPAWAELPAYLNKLTLRAQNRAVGDLDFQPYLQFYAWESVQQKAWRLDVKYAPPNHPRPVVRDIDHAGNDILASDEESERLEDIDMVPETQFDAAGRAIQGTPARAPKNSDEEVEESIDQAAAAAAAAAPKKVARTPTPPYRESSPVKAPSQQRKSSPSIDLDTSNKRGDPQSDPLVASQSSNDAAADLFVLQQAALTQERDKLRKRIQELESEIESKDEAHRAQAGLQAKLASSIQAQLATVNKEGKTAYDAYTIKLAEAKTKVAAIRASLVAHKQISADAIAALEAKGASKGIANIKAKVVEMDTAARAAETAMTDLDTQRKAHGTQVQALAAKVKKYDEAVAKLDKLRAAWEAAVKAVQDGTVAMKEAGDKVETSYDSMRAAAIKADEEVRAHLGLEAALKQLCKDELADQAATHTPATLGTRRKDADAVNIEAEWDELDPQVQAALGRLFMPHVAEKDKKSAWAKASAQVGQLKQSLAVAARQEADDKAGEAPRPRQGS